MFLQPGLGWAVQEQHKDKRSCPTSLQSAGLGWAGLAGLAGRVTAGAHQGYNTRVAVAGLGPGWPGQCCHAPHTAQDTETTHTHGDTRTMEAAVRGHGLHATADILTGRREDLFSPQVVATCHVSL